MATTTTRRDSVAPLAPPRPDDIDVRPDRGPIFATAFHSLVREHGFEPLRVEGTLPPELSGTYYRNAPGRFDVGPSPHWFDGQGAVAAVRVHGGQARGAIQLVHTPTGDHDLGRDKNRYAGFAQRMSWTQRLRAFAGGQGVRNAANINVLPWQGRLFAMYETTLPVELDPDSLASLGETDLGGVVNGAWNAHPHRVPARRATYQFGLRVGPRCFLDVYELPDAGAPRLLTTIRMPGVVEVHDMFATERHLVFAITPYWASSLRLLAKGSFLETLIKRDGQPTRFLVVPIDEPTRIVEIEAEPFFFWHAVNAFEHAGRLVLDLVRYDDFHAHARWLERTAAGEDAGPHGSSLVRYVLDPVARTARAETLHDRACEFPIVSPTRHATAHRYAWIAAHDSRHDGRGWFDRIARVDLDTGVRADFDPGARAIVGEPAIVPRSDREDDVWMISLVRDLDRGASCLAVWDGASTGGEPIARAWFDEPLPAGLHGTWVASSTT
jgi:all-trans-8'-apo-beta-carotenal 15,15'-oxygenase